MVAQATPQQITNANLANFTYQAWVRLSQLEEEQGPSIYSGLESSIKVSILPSKYQLSLSSSLELPKDL